MEEEIIRKSPKMSVLKYCFVIIVIISFVYSVDIGSTITRSIEYIGKANDDDFTENNDNSKWTYDCQNSCLRKTRNKDEPRTTLETCSMLCTTPPVWPKPTYINVTQKNSSTFNKHQVNIKLNATEEVKKDLKIATKIFMSYLPKIDESWVDDVDITSFNIDIGVLDGNTKLSISTNESYNLTVRRIGSNILVNISAQTYYGARHGLETLSQLIWLDSDILKLRIIHDVQIYDIPKFPHRGLMVDTARNYFPIKELKKVLDGMAATKLNVFHLHLTDAVSFPIVLPNNTVFAEYGAYSPEMLYTPSDVRDLVEYARIRGIRVILEIDSPSHANEGWNERGENLVICGEDDVFNGHLNPKNVETLNVLESIYRDLYTLGTDSDVFHIGGDEVNLTCWWEAAHSEGYSDMHLYWANFTNKMFDRVKSANNNKLPTHIVLWSSPLTDQYISRLNYRDNVVIQFWFGSVYSILNSGQKVIFSTVGHWYLDCGFGPWRPSMNNGVCDPYTHWQAFYRYRPWKDASYYDGQVLGGEACLWTEQVEVDSLETRIWPRTAAFAERLWSDPDNFDTYDVYTRLDIHKSRLKRRGIKTAAMWPRWCSLNPGKC